MNNPTIDNDLQKAIDDITKITGDDPIFADPVAAPAPAPMPTPAPAPKAPTPAPAPMPEPAPMEDIVTAAEPAKPTEPVKPFVEEEDLNTDQVKEAALRDLAPIVGKLDVSAEKKFEIYKTVIDEYHDSSVIAPAYKSAADIKDDKERAEALLYIIESIDNM